MTTPLQSQLRLKILYDQKDAISENILKDTAKIETYSENILKDTAKIETYTIHRAGLEARIDALNAEIIAEKERTNV